MKSLYMLFILILFYGCKDNLVEINSEPLTGIYEYVISIPTSYDKCSFQRAPLTGEICIIVKYKEIKGFITLNQITYPISGGIIDSSFSIFFCEKTYST